MNMLSVFSREETTHNLNKQFIMDCQNKKSACSVFADMITSDGITLKSAVAAVSH